MLKLLPIFLLAFSAAPYAHDGKYALPDSKLTPGAVNSAIEADPRGGSYIVNGVEMNLCAKDFRTAPFRKVDEAEKKKACLEYGIITGCPGSSYELDHLISLEIGGNDTLQNLWPQPIKQARVKDHQVEDRLPKLVCSGKMTLKEAQSCVATDWVKCAARIKGMR